jgi:SAM-dependent methyltransferase
MMGWLRDWLIDPTVKSHDVDSPEFSMAHRAVVQRKLILRRLFESFYRECRWMDLRYFGSCPGKRVEIGSGAGIIREVYDDVITSDIKILPFIDLVLSADELPFHDNSLRAIYAINVFHHLASPRDFFREITRVLHPGGGLVLIEPFYGPVASWMFKNLHKSEGFEPDDPSWEASGRTGPFSNANQALSYIVFRRDRDRFEREFPELELVSERPHTHLWYIVSGGVNFRQLLPNSMTGLAKFAEAILAPANRWIALQQTIVLRKRTALRQKPN